MLLADRFVGVILCAAFALGCGRSRREVRSTAGGSGGSTQSEDAGSANGGAGATTTASPSGGAGGVAPSRACALKGWSVVPALPADCRGLCQADSFTKRLPKLSWLPRTDWCPGCQALDTPWATTDAQRQRAVDGYLVATGAGPDLMEIGMFRRLSRATCRSPTADRHGAWRLQLGLPALPNPHRALGPSNRRPDDHLRDHCPLPLFAATAALETTKRLPRDNVTFMPSEVDGRKAARKARAAARTAPMTVEVVALGQRKPSPYAHSTPDERLAAAVRLIEYHQALRGGSSTLPRAAWPGETFVSGEELG